MARSKSVQKTPSAQKRLPRQVICRAEMFDAVLDLGGSPIELADYATTGLLAVAVGPKGYGKTNVGLLMAEQLAEQGWVCVLIDPEEELESLYGEAVGSPEALAGILERRDQKIVVVAASDVDEFVAYGETILDAANRYRKPIFLMIDEGQLFSGRHKAIGEASEIINEFVERGRKRALDLFLTAHGFTGTLHRSVFRSKNLTFIGCQQDPAAWSALAPQFRSTRIGYSDLNALGPGEFFCFGRRGVEKIRMPLAEALKKVAPKARAVRKVLPKTFQEWTRAMRGISSGRLEALTDPVVDLLAAAAGLTNQQVLSGKRALRDEIESR